MHTYRLGPTICEALQPLIPGITSKADHDTIIKVIKMRTYEPAKIQNYIDKEAVNTIITPYTYNQKILRTTLKGDNLKVVKTHSF